MTYVKPKVEQVKTRQGFPRVFEVSYREVVSVLRKVQIEALDEQMARVLIRNNPDVYRCDNIIRDTPVESAEILKVTEVSGSLRS